MQPGYFKISENVNCGVCNALNDASLIDCAYCGADFHLTPPSSLILQVREQIDALLASGNVKKANLAIDSSILNSPIVEFRLIIIELNHFLLGPLMAQPFRKQLDRLNNLVDNNINYFKAYASYIHKAMPAPYCVLTIEDYRNIIGHGLLLQYDATGIVGEALRLQIALPVLGAEQVKEIKFYLDPSNQIDDAGFQKRRKHLLDIFNHTIQEL